MRLGEEQWRHGPLYRSQHELVFVFRNGKAKHINNVQLGRFGRNRANVWNYAGANSFPRKGRKKGLDLHPTVKPIAMVADAILDSTKRDDIVLDPFCGSGTTILAAERTGRRGCGIEIDPLYVDTAIETLGEDGRQAGSARLGADIRRDESRAKDARRELGEGWRGGYKRPPKTTRWKKGQCGNPKRQY